jgi:hypothetical protein
VVTVAVAVVVAEMLEKEKIGPERDERYTYTWDALFTCEMQCEHKMAESKTMNSHWPIQDE